ncbi:hypothetical protein, partial [Candidatus Erwinia dacicola]|uniref:hypothetical protein n=1 Tax=Candidatus Erwinia dacicola TaxID=252393 RepID=UPI001C9CCAB3
GSCAAPSTKQWHQVYQRQIFATVPDNLLVGKQRAGVSPSEGIPAAAGIVNLRYKSCLEMTGQEQVFPEQIRGCNETIEIR